jgi:outer membrane lipoprotein SlyB
MEAVTSRQTGSTRISSLVVATVASATIAGLIVLGALNGVLPGRGGTIRGEEPLPHVVPQARAGACALCGTIESIRVIEVYEEASATNSNAEARTPSEAAGNGPGGAIAGGATSMFDTLTSTMKGNDAEKSLRKRHVYRVTLRMDDGSFRAISLSSPPSFAVGDKVRVVEGRLVRA